MLAVDLCALAHTEFLNEIVLCLVWRNTGGAFAATLGRCAMSRELWVVTREYEDGDFWFRYANKQKDEAKEHMALYSENNKLARYVPADSLQPEWWCEPQANGSVTFCARLGDLNVSRPCDYRSINHRRNQENLSAFVHEQLKTLVKFLAQELWCGGL